MPIKPRKPMHLVDDEVLEVAADRRSVQARVRVWRARDEAAIVLVEHIGGRSVCEGTCKFAVRIYRELLRFSPFGMHYFETEGGMLWKVTFDVIGHDDRAAFVRPSYQFCHPSTFDELSGTATFADPRDMAEKLAA